MIVGYSSIWKPLLFQLDAETAHHLSAQLLQLANSISPIRSVFEKKAAAFQNNALEKNVAGISFPNPVGLAAGYDKNGELVDALHILGFGFAEIGTVTPRPQKGNPRPRLFRIPKDGAILNRMGFNNDGVKRVSKRLSERKNTTLILGGNIGKNKDTSNETAYQDYVYCFQYLQDLVDYFTVNVSSPNTPGLRQLLEKESLSVLLDAVMNENLKRKAVKPVFLKISPDLETEAIEMIIDVCLQFEISGIVATNTTVRRDILEDEKAAVAMGSGGISGSPLTDISENVLSIIRQKAPNLTVMSSGGIMNASDAQNRFNQGADLIQLYSGLVYQGPGLPLEILKSLLKMKNESVFEY